MGKIARVGAVALLLGTYAAVAQQRVARRWWIDSPRPRGDEMMRGVMLTVHNVARVEAGMPPLAWSDTLAADAAAYAAELVRTRRFAHSPHPRGTPEQGENLWMGTRGAFRYDEMIGSWVRERRFFRDGTTPDFSTTGRWEDVAHYTQMVWRGTTKVGCAVAQGGTDDYLVCRYSPVGNVIGRTVFAADPPPAPRYAWSGG